MTVILQLHRWHALFVVRSRQVRPVALSVRQMASGDTPAWLVPDMSPPCRCGAACRCRCRRSGEDQGSFRDGVNDDASTNAVVLVLGELELGLILHWSPCILCREPNTSMHRHHTLAHSAIIRTCRTSSQSPADSGQLPLATGDKYFQIERNHRDRCPLERGYG
ncbi:hypothetical protein P170DRAFT_99520 [Aspergillus steynii IBT 23096]|uniref:Uncharacterized protein n=1 Tax=Aspergillus steynii IBT 23096 TaxID=1392250 RepID=A0A2I2GHB8_9EURO|nr:uncharacterized protein P170DRAFT_99520 [Aspergillus steynii IBT 23096]PLB52272.1 hypothetical protein P170DRAFT_99520 [Aspergillus steynii IBT 23096]